VRVATSSSRTMRAALYRSLDTTFPNGFGAPDGGGTATLRA
jgi:hypothetical protein